MEEIDYKRSFELLNRDVDACLEIIESWKKELRISCFHRSHAARSVGRSIGRKTGSV